MKRTMIPGKSSNVVGRISSVVVKGAYAPVFYKFDRRLDIDINLPKEPEKDRGNIYVPSDAKTVIYTDTDGQSYEVDINELIEADVDHEITVVDSPFDDNSCDTRSAIGGVAKKVVGPLVRTRFNMLACRNSLMQSSCFRAR